MAARKNAVPKIGITRVEAAKRLNLSQPYVSQLVSHGKFVLFSDGSIDPNSPIFGGDAEPNTDVDDDDDTNVDANAEPEKRKVGRPAKQGAEVLDFYTERARHEKAKADLMETRVQAERGVLVDRKLAEDTDLQAYGQVREGIEDATQRAAALIAAKFSISETAVRVLLEDHFFEALERLADDIEARAG